MQSHAPGTLKGCGLWQASRGSASVNGNQGMLIVVIVQLTTTPAISNLKRRSTDPHTHATAHRMHQPERDEAAGQMW
jgi:hypothetical protein